MRSQYKVTKIRRYTRKVELLAPALRALKHQAAFTKGMAPLNIEVVQRDNRTRRGQTVRFVFHSSATNQAYSTSDNLRNV